MIPPASTEVIEHHIKLHEADCEVSHPTGFWLTCPDEHMGAVMCGGCFDVLFIGTIPNDHCEHAEMFFEHVARHRPTHRHPSEGNV